MATRILVCPALFGMHWGLLKVKCAKNLGVGLNPVLGARKKQHRFLDGRAQFIDFECFAPAGAYFPKSRKHKICVQYFLRLFFRVFLGACMGRAPNLSIFQGTSWGLHVPGP